MQLSIRHKFAFLCIPKCGSTSVERAIAPFCETKLGGDASLKHLGAAKFERHIRPLLQRADPNREIETFCIMREPLDRIKSWYQYRSRPALADKKNPRHHKFTGTLTFAEFVEGYLEDNRKESVGVGSQAGFVSLAGGGIGVNRIFRLDQMDAVSDYLSEKVGSKIDIPVANKSVSGGKKSKAGEFDLPDELMARLMARLAKDYALYEKLPWNAVVPQKRPPESR
jgi:hypothetical protein